MTVNVTKDAVNIREELNALRNQGLFYEEGEWTPEITFGGASTGITYTSNVGRYTKLGQVVTLFGFINMLNKGSSTGNAQITGLPFKAINEAGASYGVNVTVNVVSFADAPMAILNEDTSVIILQEATNAGGGNTTLTDANFANNSRVYFSVVYRTDS